MASKRQALGKGLSALITTENLEQEDNNRIEDIEVDLICPNPNQPRKVFEEDKLGELAQSIKKYGVIQPIIVRKEKNIYHIIAGERRWKASKMCGLLTVPCIVRDIENKNASEIALIENIQREDLNPIDEANAYQFIMERYGISQEDVSNIVGKSRVYVTNIMRLLNLDVVVQEKIMANEITSGHGRALIGLTKERQIQLAELIIKENLSVRDVEKLIRDIKKQKVKRVQEKDQFVLHVEEMLASRLSTKVNIVNKRKKGKIEIEYTNVDDLNRILDLLKIEDN